jgi:hypothetical protein
MGLVNFVKFVWDYVTHPLNPTNLNRLNDGIDECAKAINDGLIKDTDGAIKANKSKDSEKLGGKDATAFKDANWVPAWTDVTGKPSTYPPSTHTHPYRPDTWVPAWTDVTGKPSTYPPSTHTHPYRPDTWVPAWTDVTGKPSTYPPSTHTHPYRPDTWVPAWTDVTGKPSTYPPSTHTHPYRPDTWVPAWTDVTGKPSTFPPSDHTHGLVSSSLKAPGGLDTLTNANFRTTLFGSAASGYNLSAGRWNATPSVLGGMNVYGTMMAWSGDDTHGFIAVDYSTASAMVGGGNANNIQWVKKLAFEGHTHDDLGGVKLLWGSLTSSGIELPHAGAGYTTTISIPDWHDCRVIGIAIAGGFYSSSKTTHSRILWVNRRTSTASIDLPVAIGSSSTENIVVRIDFDTNSVTLSQVSGSTTRTVVAIVGI